MKIKFNGRMRDAGQGNNLMHHHYYVNDNAQLGGDHEVHRDDCYWLSLAISKTYLGYFSSCSDAVQKARTTYRQSNGCAFCSAACHTG